VSDGRRLWIRSRRVDPECQPAYREAVAEAGDVAGEIGAHFWAFEVDGGEDRFIEFLEGPSDSVLQTLVETADESLREAGGGSATSGLRVGPSGLGCTEFA
jgi:hypothetical protein